MLVSSGKKETSGRSFLRQLPHMRQKSLHSKKNHSILQEKQSKVASPLKIEHATGIVNGAQEIEVQHRTSIPRRRPNATQQGKEVQSARTTHNKKSSISQKRGRVNQGWLRKDFDFEKFKDVFGYRKFAEKRVQTEHTNSNLDVVYKPRKQSSSINIATSSIGKKPNVRPLESTKHSKKLMMGKRRSHREMSSEGSSLAQRLIRSLLAINEGKSLSRSKVADPNTQKGYSNSGTKSKGLKTKHKLLQSKPSIKDERSTPSMLKSHKDIHDPSTILNGNDLGFLFSKKLTNIEKMNMIQQRSQLIQDRKKASIESQVIGKPSQYSLKKARLATNYSASDSLNTLNREQGNKEGQDFSKDSFLENQELEDQLEQAQRTNSKAQLASSRTKNIKRKRASESNAETPTLSKNKLSKKLFGRRKSFCEENLKDKAKRELGCELGDESLSMTSNARGYTDVDDMFEASGSFQGRSELQRSNSNILLRSIVSSSTNHLSSREIPNLQQKIEVERQLLLDYLKEYSKVHKTVPKTTLQFYKIIKLLGRGSFGKVHLGIHLLTRKRVAVKCIDKQYILEEKAQAKVVQEIKILRGLSHRNIVKILEVFENKKYVFIVTDYASRGDVLQYMKEHGIFKESKAKQIAAQILNGLQYIHDRNILHRDVKLDNILLDKDFKVRICDFGVSRTMPRHNQMIKERCGTPAYIAPEIIKNQGYSGFYADVTSC
jgi:tRNA A-37 threonylcarbamoyl transferase component Bud32